jgi:AbiV family abortive infection protein
MSDGDKTRDAEAAGQSATAGDAVSPSSRAQSELQIRQTCFDHASDLLAAAERVVADPALPNIAYHLATLALEEIGKAGMVGARAVVGASRDSEWMNKRFDDHIWKLQWAFWTPGLSTGRIDPKDFEEARGFAQRTHARRIAGLYVNPDDSTSVAPRTAVTMAHATSLLRLARARLELEQAKGEPVVDPVDDNVKWFLETMADEAGKNRLLSGDFIGKHEEFKGDSRAWVVWARKEFT